MPNTLYSEFGELSGDQRRVMQFIIDWVKTKKTPVPHHEIIVFFAKEGIKEPTVVSIIGFLLSYHFIRRAVISSNKSSYVQLRTI